MARPSFSPSAEQRRSVKAMAGLGMRHQDIAVVLEIAEKTVRKHFRQELARGAIEANAKVLQTLYGMATSGENTAATIFYAKTTLWTAGKGAGEATATGCHRRRSSFGQTPARSRYTPGEDRKHSKEERI
jgi:hypothetical protein